jgi:UDP-N-acetyl-D-galactosamine dehydrogenase
VANETVKLMLKKSIQVKDSKILVLGFTFKENCPDVRNTKVIDIVKTLKEYKAEVTIYDPWASPVEVKHEYNLDLQNTLPDTKFDAVILAVAHDKFAGCDIEKLVKPDRVIFDVKSCLNPNIVDGRL